MKRKEVVEAYRLHTNRSKNAIKYQYLTARPENNRRKSYGNEYEFSKRHKNRISFQKDEYKASLQSLKRKRKEMKHITAESSRNTSKLQPSRPVSTKRKHGIGLYKHDNRKLNL